MCRFRFSRAVSAIVAAITFTIYTLPLSADTTSCDAGIDGESSNSKGSIEIAWIINVSDCKQSKGEYEFVIRLADNDGKVRDLLRTGAWSLRATDEPFRQIDKLNVPSDAIFKEMFGANVTSCTCVGSGE